MLAAIRYRLRSLLWHRSIFMVPALAQVYRARFGAWPSLLHPRTFNEKLYVRMALDRREILQRMAGKLEARAFVAERLGRSDMQAALLGVIRSLDDAEALALPTHWIMKVSHASGAVRVVTPEEPISPDEMKATIARWLQIDYGRYGLEWCYHGLERVVVVEELLQQDGKVPRDIKFFCFDGKVVYIQVDSSRFDRHTQSIFDLGWNRLDVLVKDYLPDSEPVAKPALLDEMIAAAERLSAGIDFLRVDMFDLGADFKVGELTNYPQGGSGTFKPANWDLEFGSHWKMPKLPVLRGWRR